MSESIKKVWASGNMKGNTGNVAWNKGIPRTDEQKENHSQKLKGRPSWNKGKKNWRIYTEEMRQNQSNRMSGLNNPMAGKSIGQKKCVAINLITKEELLFNSLKDAAKATTVSSGHISSICKGKRFQSKNWIFKYN